MKKVYSLLAVSALTLAATQASAAVYNVTSEMNTVTTTSTGLLSGAVTTTTQGTGTIDTATGLVTVTNMVLSSDQVMVPATAISGIITVDLAIDSANSTGTQIRTACTDTSASVLTCNGPSSPAIGVAAPIAGITGNTWLGNETTGDQIVYSTSFTTGFILGGTMTNAGTVTVTLGEPVP